MSCTWDGPPNERNIRHNDPTPKQAFRNIEDAERKAAA